jgi:hypothetical protein
MASQSNDARGLLIPNDICINKDRLKLNPAVFWGSSQFYIKGDAEDMLRRLAIIPDDHFRHIPSLCLDFGWHTTYGIVDPWLPSPGTADERPHYDKERRLLDHILSKGSKTIVVKVLWTTSLSMPLESSCTWQYDQGDGYSGWGCDNLLSELDDPVLFEEWFRSWGYCDRVRLITRVQWQDEWPDEINWEGVEIARYCDSEDKMFKIDPISKKMIWNDEKTVVRMPDGLVWELKQQAA